MSFAQRLIKQTGDLLVERIGGTPLLALDRITDDLADETGLSAKAEFFNPGGSIKDRAALDMIVQAERTGELRGGVRILEASSGNMGISLAMVGAARGHPVTLCVPENTSEGRKRLLTAYGAELVLTDAAAGDDGALVRAREMHRESPGKWFYTDQYANPASWQAHYKTTALEIFRQTDGAVTHFVAGLGTSGTFVGVGRRLKELNPDIRLIAVQPDSPLHGLDGMRYYGSGAAPAIFDRKLAGRTIQVGTEEALAMTIRLARELGIVTGLSSGANVIAAAETARSVPRGIVVTILCDGGERTPKAAPSETDER